MAALYKAVTASENPSLVTLPTFCWVKSRRDGKKWVSTLSLPQGSERHASWLLFGHVCMYVCMYVCMPVYTYICMDACMHVCMRGVCMHVFMYACMRACVHACMRACVHACMRACVHACMHVGWLVGWLVSWLAGWLVGWLAVCMYYVCTHARIGVPWKLNGCSDAPYSEDVGFRDRTWTRRLLRAECGSAVALSHIVADPIMLGCCAPGRTCSNLPASA